MNPNGSCNGVADEPDVAVAEVEEMPRRERAAGRVVADDPRHRLDRRRVDIDEDDRDGLRSERGTTASARAAAT